MRIFHFLRQFLILILVVAIAFPVKPTFAQSAPIPVPPSFIPASFKCEELPEKRFCRDRNTKSASASGITVPVSPPILPGFESGGGCWEWERVFQCVEKSPQFFCQSGADYTSVKARCDLVPRPVIRDSRTIGGAFYILDADYKYACPFEPFTPITTLPHTTDTPCDKMNDGLVVDEATMSVYPDGSEPSSGIAPGAAEAQSSVSIVSKQSRIDPYVCYSQPVKTCETYCGNLSLDSSVTTPALCNASALDCVEGTEVPGIQSNITSFGPTGRSLAETQTSICRTGPIPTCSAIDHSPNKDNCSLSSVKGINLLNNGQATSQHQTHICSQTTRSCPDENMVEVSNCTGPNAWGLDNWGGAPSQTLNGFAELNQTLAQLQGIEKGASPSDIFIFSGAARACNFAVGSFWNTFALAVVFAVAIVATGGAAGVLMGTSLSVSVGVAAVGTATVTVTAGGLMAAALVASAASEAVDSKVFGNDCCKDLVVDGSDKWWKLGRKCTSDEVKLAIAKRKALAVYLGEYCSSESGWLFKSCVQRTRSYCVFDDMLAMTVNEQGRTQLDQIASSNDPGITNTSATPIIPFSVYTDDKPINVTGPDAYSSLFPLNNVGWNLVPNSTNEPLYYWKYPFYCKSPATMLAAKTAHENENNTLIKSMEGKNPKNSTPQESAVLLQSLVKIPPLMDCGDVGEVNFLTCDSVSSSSQAAASCDPNRKPGSPYSSDVDLTGQISSAQLESSSAPVQADVSWKIQRIDGDKVLGGFHQYVGLDAPYSQYVKSSQSIHPLITATGSCLYSATTPGVQDGSCAYQFDISQRTSGGVGGRKLKKETIEFPLYSFANTVNTPVVSYLPIGESQLTDEILQNHNGDPLRGAGLAQVINKQNFIFRPVLGTLRQQGAKHSTVLLEHLTAMAPSRIKSDYAPILVPTDLQPGTQHWAAFNPHPRGFNMEGECSPGSLWCKYTVTYKVPVSRHPWGDARNPRCWGFTVEQLQVLDFSKMDLSRWINSMDLTAFQGSKKDSSQAKIKAQATETATNFYNTFKEGEATNRVKPPGTNVAMHFNSEVFPILAGGEAGESYLLNVALPTHWPGYVPGGSNTNAVTKITMNWGRPAPIGTVGIESSIASEDLTPLKKCSASSPNTCFYQVSADYGGQTPGRYRVTATLSTTSSGDQLLSGFINVTPNGGSVPVKSGLLDVTESGYMAKTTEMYNPSTMEIGKTNKRTAQASPGQLTQSNSAAGAAVLFENQGAVILDPNNPLPGPFPSGAQ